MSSPYPTLGSVVEAAYSDTLGEWCKEHAHGRPYLEAVSLDVTEVQINTTLRRSGRGLVVVSVDAVKPWNQIVEAYVVEGTPWSTLSDILTAKPSR